MVSLDIHDFSLRYSSEFMAQVWCSQVNVNHGFEYGDMVGDGVYRCMGVNAWCTPFAFSGMGEGLIWPPPLNISAPEGARRLIF